MAKKKSIYWLLTTSVLPLSFSFFCFYLSEPYTEILGGKDVFIDQHSALNLTCVIHAPEPPAHIFWIHDDHVSQDPV